MGLGETLRICEFMRIFLQQVRVVNYVYLMSNMNDSSAGLLCAVSALLGVEPAVYTGEGWYLFFHDGKVRPKHVQKRGDEYLDVDGNIVQGQLMGKIAAYMVDGSLL